MIALRVLVTALGAALGVLYPFTSVILADFGFSPGEIGFISSLGAVGFTFAVPAWGHLADVRLGRPRTLQVCATGGATAMIALVVPVPPPVVVGLFVLFWVFMSSLQPLVDAITVNALRGRDYARVRLFTSLGFAVAAILAGQLYDRTGYQAAFPLFALAAGVMVAAAALLPDVARADLDAHRRLAPGGAGSGSPAPSWRRSLGSSGVALQVAPRLAAVLLAVGLLHVGTIAGFTFLSLRIEALGGSPAQIALSSGLSAGIEIPAMFVMGGLAQRLGLRVIFTTGALLYALCLASWTVLDTPLAIVATRAITGLAYSGIVVGVVLTIATLLPAELQATGQSLLQTITFGFAAVVANVLGGLLYEGVGHVAVFGIGAILAVGAAVVGWLVFPAGPRGGPSPPIASRDERPAP